MIGHIAGLLLCGAMLCFAVPASIYIYYDLRYNPIWKGQPEE